MTDPLHGLPARLAELRQALAAADPVKLAERAGATFEPDPASGAASGCFPGVLHLPVWGQPVQVAFPQFEACREADHQPLGLLEQVLLAYYFTLTDGSSPANRWISFTELPEGRFYTRAFQGYTGEVLAKTFGSDLAAFKRAALGCLGTSHNDLGEASYEFLALPRLPVLVVVWLGDEDFPTRYQVLFDAHAGRHLTTDGCAILGSALVRRLKAQAQRSKDL
ncbi:MAG: DUF3786 domain-containing protein [Anaerolineales bacterium]|jgi:hypothetical protein